MRLGVVSGRPTEPLRREFRKLLARLDQLLFDLAVAGSLCDHRLVELDLVRARPLPRAELGIAHVEAQAEFRHAAYDPG